MLLTMVDTVSCENPECRDFAKIVTSDGSAKTYYCLVCGKISHARAVDVNLIASPERYRNYLLKVISSPDD